MLGTSVVRLCCGILVGVLVSFGIGATIVAVGLYDTESRARELPMTVSNISNSQIPNERPEIGQKSIDMAMAAFAIRVPQKIKGPFYDAKLEDRGLTIRHGLGSAPIVYIGKDAFDSWALLGSTLAHEIEVHCRQNFLAIHLQNVAGFDGTGIAEREAYQYELGHSQRFGLAQFDQDLIKSAMTYFYPERDSVVAGRFMPVKLWVDRFAANAFLKRSLY